MAVRSLKKGCCPAPVVDDGQLVEQVLQGKQRAFDSIVRCHNRRLYYIARGIISDAGEAEDIVQESYLHAYLNLLSFDAGKGSLAAWLNKIVINQALSQLRKRSSRCWQSLDELLEHTELADGSGIFQLPAPALNEPEARVAGLQTNALLEQAIAGLPAPFRSVFMLREVEQLSLAETSRALGIPVATVKTRAFRARRILRITLRDK
jgi:RNA polymerase sigma-70 factor (ECF subfamily)